MDSNKLTKSQERVLKKLTRNLQSAYELRESRLTLDVLVRKGFAQRVHSLGSIAFPRNAYAYKLKH